MNDEDERALVFGFRVDDQSVHVAAIVLYGGPLAVTRRFIDTFARPGLRPFLRGKRWRAERHSERGAEQDADKADHCSSEAFHECAYFCLPGMPASW